MLLITMYCCSVHVFFPAFSLTAVRQETAKIMIVNV